MDERVDRITTEIAAVVERNLRRELLREREAMLRKELEAVRNELGRLSGAVGARATTARRVAARPRPTQTPAGSKPARGRSARALIIQTLKRAGRPMTIKELIQAISRKGWTSKSKNPPRSVDAALRNNPQDFRRTAPSTFKLNR